MNDLPDVDTLSLPLPETLAVLQQGIDAGLHIGAQLHIWRAGEVVANLGIGESRPGVPMRAATLMMWLSATKPIGAVAIGQLLEAGKLKLDDPIAHFIPEFAAGGKGLITLRHLLTHTAGFRWLETHWPRTPWDEIIALICAMPMEANWPPGEKAGYHPTTSWFILGELVRRLDGRPYERYVREEIFLPLGMKDSWVGMPPEQYDTYGQRIGILQKTEKPPAVPLPPFDTREAAVRCRPGANGLGPVRELGRFYQALLGDGSLDGKRILEPSTVQRLTSRQRIGMYDQTFRHVIDWGLGFIVNSNRYGVDSVPYGFGAYAGESTFGHNGMQSSTAFADPEHKLVVALVCNGTPGEIAHHRRMREIDAAIYRDLELAPR